MFRDYNDIPTTSQAQSSAGRKHLLLEEWNWSALRDYVISEIEKRRTISQRDATKEYGIFNSFVKRWGVHSRTIAEFAFGDCNGVWDGLVVSPTSFCKNADVWFATPIAEHLGLEV